MKPDADAPGDSPRSPSPEVVEEAPEGEELREWRVEAEGAEQRLDRYLAEYLDRPRNRIQRWIRDGRITVEGRVAKPSYPVAAGARVACRLPSPGVDAAAQLEAEAGELVVLHEDPHLVVVDKPAGLAVHPGAGRPRGTLAHRLLHHYPEMAAVGGPGRPGLVHRLDLDTTGAMVAARPEAAYLALGQAFAERAVDKRYVAIVYGRPRHEAGTIDRPLARHRHDRKRMAVRGDGRPARTRYRRRASLDALVSILDLAIETGRTHQIRAHLEHLGHPLVGDATYGGARWKGAPKNRQKALRDCPRPALHARRLAFRHPITGEPLEVEAREPDDLRALWQQLGGTAWPEPVDA